MAKARGPTVDAGAAALPLLVKLAEAGDELQLVGPDALLAKKTGPGKAVYDHLTADANPLVTRITRGKTEFARLTAAGFVLALPHLPAERVGELARRFADRLPAAERLTFFVQASKVAGTEAAVLLAEAADALAADLEEQKAIDTRRRQAERAVLDRLVALKRADADRLQAELAAARSTLRGLAALAGDEPTIEADESAPERAEVKRPDAAAPLVATDPDDHPFRRQVVRRLVTSWLDAATNGRDEGQRFVQAALSNIGGVRAIGAVGETVPFDGTVHHAARSVSDGEPVRVVRIGWELDEDDGPYMVLPAEVE